MLLEEERAELMGCFVQSVEMTEKETVTIKLLPVIMSPPLFYSKGFELNPNLEAERSLNSNHFTLFPTLRDTTLLLNMPRLR